MWQQIFYFKPRRENLTGLLLCVDWSLSRSTDHRDRNLHSLSLEVRHTTLSLHLSVNMYVFNVKSYTEYHKDRKGIWKAVTGLVSVPVSKTLVWLVARWPRDEGRDIWQNKIPWVFPEVVKMVRKFPEFSRFSLIFFKKVPFSRFSKFSMSRTNPVK